MGTFWVDALFDQRLHSSSHPAADTLIDVRFGQSSRGVVPDPAQHSAQKKRKQNKIVNCELWIMMVNDEWWVLSDECWIGNGELWLNFDKFWISRGATFVFTVNGGQHLRLCPIAGAYPSILNYFYSSHLCGSCSYHPGPQASSSCLLQNWGLSLAGCGLGSCGQAVLDSAPDFNRISFCLFVMFSYRFCRLISSFGSLCKDCVAVAALLGQPSGAEMLSTCGCERSMIAHSPWPHRNGVMQVSRMSFCFQARHGFWRSRFGLQLCDGSSGDLGETALRHQGRHLSAKCRGNCLRKQEVSGKPPWRLVNMFSLLQLVLVQLRDAEARATRVWGYCYGMSRLQPLDKPLETTAIILQQNKKVINRSWELQHITKHSKIQGREGMSFLLGSGLVFDHQCHCKSSLSVWLTGVTVLAVLLACISWTLRWAGKLWYLILRQCEAQASKRTASTTRLHWRDTRDFMFGNMPWAYPSDFLDWWMRCLQQLHSQVWQRARCGGLLWTMWMQPEMQGTFVWS